MLDRSQWIAIGLVSGFAYILGKDRESFGAEEFEDESFDAEYRFQNQATTSVEADNEEEAWDKFSGIDPEESWVIERMDAESFEAEKKNCGCGQDPCVTYGAEPCDA